MSGGGMGSVAKLINNQLSFSNMAAAAEALVIGAMSGIDLAKLDQVIENASGFSWAYRSWRDEGVRRRLQGEFRARPRAQGLTPRPRTGRRARRAGHDRHRR